MNRPGAEVRRMRSMWDSIHYHTIPVDRMAAFVASHGPWWLNDFCESAPLGLNPKREERLSIEQVVNITRPPPDGIKDFRGVRSKHHAIVGFSHRKEKVCNMNPSRRKQMVRNGYYIDRNPHKYMHSLGGEERPKSVARFSVWFCMRRDGAVLLVNQRRLTRTMNNLDWHFEHGVDPTNHKRVKPNDR